MILVSFNLSSVVLGDNEKEKMKMENKTNSRWESFKDLLDQNIDRLFGLKFRWMDEKDYEDFNDYIKLVRELFDGTGFEFKKWTKRGELILEADGKEYSAKFMASGVMRFKSSTIS